MNATQVIPGNIQADCQPQILQLLAGRVRLARKPSQVHSYGQIGSLDVRSRDAGEIRISGSDLGNCCNHNAAAVPLWACLAAPVNLLQLRVIHISAKPLLNRAHIAAQRVCGDLVAPKRSAAEVVHKIVGVDGVPCSDVVRDDELRIAIERQPGPLIAPLSGSIAGLTVSMAANISPKFIKLDEVRTDIADSGIEHAAGTLSRRNQQAQDGVFVRTSKPGDGADASSFQHHGDDLRGFFQRDVVAFEPLGLGIGESGFAVEAAVTLYAVASVEAEAFNRSVLALRARHGLLPLAFSGEKPDNGLEVQSSANPAIELAPTRVSAQAGALSVTAQALWWLDCEFQRKADVDSHRDPLSTALFPQGGLSWAQNLELRRTEFQSQSARAFSQVFLFDVPRISALAVAAREFLYLSALLQSAHDCCNGSEWISLAAEVEPPRCHRIFDFWDRQRSYRRFGGPSDLQNCAHAIRDPKRLSDITDAGPFLNLVGVFVAKLAEHADRVFQLSNCGIQLVAFRDCAREVSPSVRQRLFVALGGHTGGT